MHSRIPHRLAVGLVVGLVVTGLSACGGPKEDQLRTVRAYEFATCDSTPTTDATERAALAAFKSEIDTSNFIRSRNTLTVANHEERLEASGLRQYEGPFYWYLHPGKVESRDAAQGVTWSGLAYLHASKVRFRANGGDWDEWQRVRTRNFGDRSRTADGMPRWKCLVGSEIAWASVKLRNGQWEVEPLAISVYEQPELERLHPLPTRAQIEGKEAVEPKHVETQSDARQARTDPVDAPAKSAWGG
jgi:hypothetical protein